MAYHLWLQNNRRFAAWSLLVPGLLTVAGLVAALLLPGGGAWTWLKVLAWLAFALGLLWALLTLRQIVRPRIACDGEYLLIDTGLPRRTAIPLEVVECFLLGQGPAFLPGRKLAAAETATVVVRLAEKAEAWQRGPIYPLVGSWCDGYIILRGTFCEPLSVEVVQRLNSLLAESHRALRQRGQSSKLVANEPASSSPRTSSCAPTCLPPPCPPGTNVAQRERTGSEGDAR